MAAAISTMALLLGAILGFMLIGLGLLLIPWAVRAMGATGEVCDLALQDMRTPLKIAVGLNVLNILLDPLLIFGWGPVPAMGIAGAALASVVSQWIGALWAVVVMHATLGFNYRMHGGVFCDCFILVGIFF